MASVSKAINSLAVLKVNWDFKNIDYIESFVPFLVHLISIRKYESIDVEQIRNDFLNEFGLNLPYHPAVTVLNRAAKRGFIRKQNLEYVPVWEKIVDEGFAQRSQEQQRKFGAVVESFLTFCSKNYGISMAQENAERAILAFLKNEDLAIIFGQGESVLPMVGGIKKTDRFLIAKFVRGCKEKNPEVFKFIVDVAIGQLLAYTILYNEFDNYTGDLKNSAYFLDVGFIFYLLGVNGEAKEAAYRELVNALNETGASLYIFEHTFDECLRILNSDLGWIERGDFDYSRANRTLRFFLDNEFTASDVEEVIAGAQSKLESLKIQIVSKPILEEQDYKYSIGEAELKNTILDTYRKTSYSFTPETKEKTIQLDIDSISAIFLLRRGINPQSLELTSHVFVTTNAGLARACQAFVSKKGEFSIPPCLHDIFVGTVLWLKSPAKVHAINEKKIIADAYAALQPDETLINRYIKKIEELHSRKSIDENEFRLLRSSRVARNLLQEKTLGNVDNFSDKTSDEILLEIRAQIRKEEEQKYLKERGEHSRTQQNLKAAEGSIEIERMRRQEIELRAVRLSGVFAKALAWLIFSVLAIILGWVIVLEFFENAVLKWIWVPALIIFSVLNVLWGINLWGFKKWLEKKIERFIVSVLLGK